MIHNDFLEEEGKRYQVFCSYDFENQLWRIDKREGNDIVFTMRGDTLNSSNNYEKIKILSSWIPGKSELYERWKTNKNYRQYFIPQPRAEYNFLFTSKEEQKKCFEYFSKLIKNYNIRKITYDE